MIGVSFAFRRYGACWRFFSSRARRAIEIANVLLGAGMLIWSAYLILRPEHFAIGSARFLSAFEFVRLVLGLHP